MWTKSFISHVTSFSLVHPFSPPDTPQGSPELFDGNTKAETWQLTSSTVRLWGQSASELKYSSKKSISHWPPSLLRGVLLRPVHTVHGKNGAQQGLLFPLVFLGVEVQSEGVSESQSVFISVVWKKYSFALGILADGNFKLNKVVFVAVNKTYVWKCVTDDWWLGNNRENTGCCITEWACYFKRMLHNGLLSLLSEFLLERESSSLTLDQ